MTNEEYLRGLARQITDEFCGGAPFAVGEIVKHPSGRMVKITGGQWWGKDGLSNFWYWREVLEDGSLSAREEHGYGWEP